MDGKTDCTNRDAAVLCLLEDALDSTSEIEESLNDPYFYGVSRYMGRPVEFAIELLRRSGSRRRPQLSDAIGEMGLWECEPQCVKVAYTLMRRSPRPKVSERFAAAIDLLEQSRYGLDLLAEDEGLDEDDLNADELKRTAPKSAVDVRRLAARASRHVGAALGLLGAARPAKRKAA